MAIWAVLLLAPWVFMAVLLSYPERRADRSVSAAASDAVRAEDDLVRKCRPGPWGDLQYSRIVIEPPDEFAVADYSRTTPPRWTFIGYSRERLGELWHTAQLSADAISRLEDASETTSQQIVVRPPVELVLELSSHARTVIYSALSPFPENPEQYEPFRFRADTANEWFENSDLAPETIHLVERLLYRRGTSLLFSDHNVVLPRIASNSERVRLVKVLARKSTLLVTLRVGPDSDLDTLADYWGRGPRRKGMRALLESLAQRQGGLTIDVAHLLPRFPRAHLFNYPQLPEEGAGHDCHWTSLNFFNDPPDARFVDTAWVKQVLEREYAPIPGRPQLGDILMFLRADETVVHSCVYVADDIVFTKNGASEVMPWILMNVSDLVAFYPSDPPLTIRAYRRKDL